MDHYHWRILLVDDDRDDYFIVRELLGEAWNDNFLLEWAPNCAKAREALSSLHFDAVLVDYDLGAEKGTDLIYEAICAGYPSPMILLTGHGNYEIDVLAMQCGAADYLNKNEINARFLERSIRYAIERKRSQEEQRQMAAQQAEFETQVEVQRRLMEQREMERLNIARDLHDGVLQELTALSFAIAEAMDTDAKEARIARLKAAQQALLKQAHEIRMFCNELRPPALAHFGLERAIRSHANEFRARLPHTSIHLHLTPDQQILPETTRMALFRIYQEVLNNIAKHAQASDLWVTLTVDPSEVVLEIEDNGVGFTVPNDWVELARTGHLGLIGMRERAMAVNAQIEFDSVPGRGSRVCVTVQR